MFLFYFETLLPALHSHRFHSENVLKNGKKLWIIRKPQKTHRKVENFEISGFEIVIEYRIYKRQNFQFDIFQIIYIILVYYQKWSRYKHPGMARKGEKSILYFESSNASCWANTVSILHNKSIYFQLKSAARSIMYCVVCTCILLYADRAQQCELQNTIHIQ